MKIALYVEEGKARNTGGGNSLKRWNQWKTKLRLLRQVQESSLGHIGGKRAFSISSTKLPSTVLAGS